MTAGTRTLDVVVIARNEAARIEACIASVLAATRERFTDAQVVIVDSDSTDGTAAIAAKHPVHVYRYRARRMTAAAGRAIGFKQTAARYVLFVDGDCQLVPGWLELAIATMDDAPNAGVICGSRRNAYAGADGNEFEDAGDSLGGTALYRAAAFVGTGGFNPFIIAGEEQELAARIAAAGFQLLRTRAPMSVHNTDRKESPSGIWRRCRSGMQGGPGQVLRAAWRDGLFWHHARRYNRYVLTALDLGVGLACLALALTGRPAALAAWAAIWILLFLVLAARRRSLREAAFIVADWISVAAAGSLAFLRAPARPETFEYELERIDRARPVSLAGVRRAADASGGMPR
ncbi:MAG TPA: glycosyltransferase family A protein [Candidatus Binatia bacterium]|jgi:glycosyltransferase involved in cell wall biosynthesis